MNDFTVFEDKKIEGLYREALQRPHSSSKSCTELILDVSEKELVRAGNILSYLRGVAQLKGKSQLALEIGLTLKALRITMVKSKMLPLFSMGNGQKQIGQPLPKNFRNIIRKIEGNLNNNRRGIL